MSKQVDRPSNQYWIDVNAFLPEPDVDVLVIIEREPFQVDEDANELRYFNFGRRRKQFRTDKHFWVSAWNKFDSLESADRVVTYWMPLPELPDAH